MKVSTFILEIGKDIEEKSGLYVNFAKGSTRAIEEWIPEDQIAQMKRIELRNAKETQSEEGMKLVKFNPSFRLKERGRIRCRVPECSVTRPSCEPAEKVKQDLFLCDEHRKVLTNLVAERCAKENIMVNMANYSHEDFDGYTHLIGLLDRAFRHVMKKSSRSSTDIVLAEVFLNTRNFLFLTNALLNPDGDNKVIALTSYFTVFISLLQNLMSDSTVVQNLLATLREVAHKVLWSFGIVYSWVVMVDPGSRLGAGIGLLLGFFGGVSFGFSNARILVTSIVGLFAGKLVGGGSYNWNRGAREIAAQHDVMMKYQEFLFKQFGRTEYRNAVYRVDANSAGDLSVNVEQIE